MQYTERALLEFTTHSLGREYKDLLMAVIDGGEEVKPRGMLTKEARPLVLTLTNPVACIVDRPQFNRALMWMEVIQIMAGQFNWELFNLISPSAAILLNHYGAYGPRTTDQLPGVVEELEKDPDSRRAVAYIARPTDLLYADDLQMPCTMEWVFHVRNGRLELQTYMRSWDLVWGLSYDVPNNVALQQMVADSLNLPLGPYTHVAASGHVYAKHWDLIEKVGRTNEKLDASFGMPNFGMNRMLARSVLKAAKEASEGDTSGLEGIAEGTTWADAAQLWLKKFKSE